MHINGRTSMARPAPTSLRNDINKYQVKVEVDSISRDDPTIDFISGVTHIDVSQNGDLLFHQSRSFPTVGYTSGAWISFEVIIDENSESLEEVKKLN
jgi:hypothetical protein